MTHHRVIPTTPTMTMTSQPVITTLLLISVTIALTESRLFNDFHGEDIKRLARLVMSCGQIPGMSLVVVKDSERWTVPLGVANVESQEPVRQSTNFVIASLTKAFTSTLLLMLLKDSKKGYTVDTTIKDILNRDDLFPDLERSKEATVKDILSHRMGLARADLALFAGYPDDFSLGNLSNALSCLPVQAPFRDGFIYSNFMYSLAGHVIERLANQSYADALRDRILQPLGMTSSLTQYNFSHPKHSMAQPYMFVDDKVLPADHSLFRLPVFLPALGLATNALDMAIWLQTLLKEGVSPAGRQVIPRDVVAMTQYPVTPCIINQLRPRFPQPELTFAYGMGWFQSTYKGFRRMWHAGTLYGFTSMAWLFPDMRIAVFATTNGPSRSEDTKNQIKTLLSYIVDNLLGFPSWIDPAKACTYSDFLNQQSQTTNNKNQNKDSNSNPQSAITNSCNPPNQTYFHSTEELEKYVGIFHNKLFGKVYIELVDRKLVLNSSQTVLGQACPGYKGPRSGKILRATFGERFSGLLHATSNKNMFQMEPTGIFEFSAHGQGNKDSTMPVEFFVDDGDEDGNDDGGGGGGGVDGAAYKLKAVWQAVEMIQFSRQACQTKCFVDDVVVTSGGGGDAVRVSWENWGQLLGFSICLMLFVELV